MDFFSVVGSASKSFGALGAFGGWRLRLLAWHLCFSHQFLKVGLLWSYIAVEFPERRLPWGLLEGRLENTVNSHTFSKGKDIIVVFPD